MATVLWLGDAGSHTGFGRVTHAIGERLVSNYGHDVHVLAYNYRGDYWPTNLKLYVPNIIDPKDLYGLSRHIELLAKVEPDVVVMLNDANLLIFLLFENRFDQDHYLLRLHPIISYIPVDGINRPPRWSEITGKYTNAVAMSKFGQDAMPGSKLVYHGVDHDKFRPISESNPMVSSTGLRVTSKREAKEVFGYPADSFLVLRVDKNSGRKDFASTIRALWPVMKRHSDVICHLHTSSGRQSEDNLVIEEMLNREPDLQKRFYTPGLHTQHIGWSEEDLQILYNAADLFVTTSRGEGFGLTLAEAVSSGVPVIAQNVSAIPEVVGPGGVLLEPKAMVTVPSGQDLWLADVDAFTEAIEHLYLSRGARRSLSEKGREHIVNSFSWDVAAAKFDRYITALATHPRDSSDGMETNEP